MHAIKTQRAMSCMDWLPSNQITQATHAAHTNHSFTPHVRAGVKRMHAHVVIFTEDPHHTASVWQGRQQLGWFDRDRVAFKIGGLHGLTKAHIFLSVNSKRWCTRIVVELATHACACTYQAIVFSTRRERLQVHTRAPLLTCREQCCQHADCA